MPPEQDLPEAMRLALQLNRAVHDCLYLALAKRLGPLSYLPIPDIRPGGGRPWNVCRAHSGLVAYDPRRRFTDAALNAVSHRYSAAAFIASRMHATIAGRLDSLTWSPLLHV